MNTKGFIAIPLKKSSEIDLVEPIKNASRNFIFSWSPFDLVAHDDSDHNDSGLRWNGTRADFTNVVTELNKLRMNLRTLDNLENSLDVLTRYYDQLNFLDAKCPSVNFNIPFKWKDAFEKERLFRRSDSLTIPTLAFEKVGILFNIAAMQSQVACRYISDTKNDDGLKLAAKYFQMSSGTFKKLKTIIDVQVMSELTPDLYPDTLTALSALMLAQAQESFFFKATEGNMKDGIVAKVAFCASELYSDALKNMQKEGVVNILEKEWIPIVSGKHAGFAALAEYYQSLVCKASKDVGEEIARLSKALELMTSVKRCNGGEFKDHAPRMQQNFDKAKKDNNFIYHARVPDYKSLDPIGQAPLAKPIMPGDKMNPQSEDTFRALVHEEEVNVRPPINRTPAAPIKRTPAAPITRTPAARKDTSGNASSQQDGQKMEAVQQPVILLRSKKLLDETSNVEVKLYEEHKQLKAELNELRNENSALKEEGFRSRVAVDTQTRETRAKPSEPELHEIPVENQLSFYYSVLIAVLVLLLGIYVGKKVL